MISDYSTAVVALGGNAISPKNEIDTIENQFRNTRKSLRVIQHLIENGLKLAITHGNGPQVGNALLRVELTDEKTPVLPLGICVADTEGGMGYMIEQSLQNLLKQMQIDRDVVTIISQVLVDKNDSAIHNPTKFVGQHYNDEQIQKRIVQYNWQVKKDANKGWRRVVPSPKPISIINHRSIKKLVDARSIVIAAGGGGIPVYMDQDGKLEGLDAVIDKDLVSAILAKNIHADIFFILTDVDYVYLNFGKPNQTALEQISMNKMAGFLREDHFQAGSMLPKIQAALDFLQNGGKTAIITSLKNMANNPDKLVGTIIQK